MMNMKRYFTILFLALAVAFVGCKEIQNEIDELYTEIEELKKNDAEFKKKLDSYNESLTSLQKIVSALQSGLYIKSVMPLVEDEVQVGYIFTLSNGETFKVCDGKDGEDGYMPKVGIVDDGHGNYWWTLDGEILKDESGNNVPANGLVPQFSIVDGLWNVSYDGGRTWISLGKAVGEDGADGLPGDQLFSKIEYTEGGNTVRFILSDGTTLVLPCYQSITIRFDVQDNCTGIAAGETIKVDYSLSYGNDKTVVTASTDGNYTVRVEKRNNVSGSIFITCPGLYMDGHVNVMAYDGVGYTSMAVISFFEKQMYFNSGTDRELEYRCGTDPGSISVPVRYNFAYDVEIEEGAKSWLTIDRTRSAFREGEIAFSYSENIGGERYGRIFIRPENSAGEPYATITVIQDAARFEMDLNMIVAGSYDKLEKKARIRSSRRIVVECTKDWVHTTLEQAGHHKYELTVILDQNSSGDNRGAKVLVKAADDGSVLKVVEVLQLSEESDDKKDLVFVVRVSEVNDYTAYLPIGNFSDGEAYIQWGDNKFTTVTPNDNGGCVSHKYDVDVPSTFNVRVSGQVRRMCSDQIPTGMRSAIIEVKQWGNVGLRDMFNAFNGNTALEKIAEDELMGFSEVISFDSAFESCPRLNNIPSGLFRYAKSADNFYEVFYHCLSLTEVPDRLFEGCSAAILFGRAFHECFNLETIGRRVFGGCTSARYFYDIFNRDYNLKSIPADLFEDAISAVNLDRAFLSCSKICSIPEGLFNSLKKAESFDGTFSETSISDIPSALFANNPDAYNFANTFSSCHMLKSVPVSLFDNNRKVTIFGGCFGWCYCVIDGESPYTVIDGKKVHLYERVDNPDYFVTPINYSYCFCTTQFSDEMKIPNNWIEN